MPPTTPVRINKNLTEYIGYMLTVLIECVPPPELLLRPLILRTRRYLHALIEKKSLKLVKKYLDDNNEHSLEEQVDSIPISHPEVYPKYARYHEYGTHINRKRTDRFLVADEFQL